MIQLRRGVVGLTSVLMVAGFAAVGAGTAVAEPDTSRKVGVTARGDEGPLAQQVRKAKQSGATKQTDDLPNQDEEKRRALRQRALDLVISGKRNAIQKKGSTVVKLGTKKATLTKKQLGLVNKGQRVKTKTVAQYVELSREKTDKIFVVLAEFGDERKADYPDQDTAPAIPGPATFSGPLHNAIPEPDRSKDNSTVWQPNYSADYYRKLYFGTGKNVESLKTYYEKQSSGRYSVNGLVTDWVKVRYNEARYGRSDGYPCATNVCSNTWFLISDAVNQWVASQKAKGQTDAQIKASLASYDTWDRNDFDGDGNFNEPDGYIDHFQIVHSGGDQANGDPQQGEDAIWSHRWKAFQGTTAGPTANPDGGTQIGNTGLWVADYTIQPENGGLSVFAHEYAHDLGLPDLYDTSGGEDGVAWWSLMAQSRAKAKTDIGLGTRPADLGAWDKLQLGWLDYETARAGQQKTLKLGPHEYNTKNAQGLVVVLPQKQVTTPLVEPATGTKSWWSGSGDDLTNTLTRQVTLPSGSSTLSFKARYDIEDCGPDPCDYAYVEVDNGTGWKAIPGNITKAAEGNGIDGTVTGWVPATFDLSAYAGKTIGLRFHYTTDGAAGGLGFFADDISVTAGGATVFTDGAETGTGGWTADGFTAVGASITKAYSHYYIASYRSYLSYDRYLKGGPYNFGFGATLPDKVEFFPYQDGLLVSYWDTSYADNNVNQHAGSGLILPIDAHPAPLYNLSGLPWRTRIQKYDATFGLQKADSFTLHLNGSPQYVRGQRAQPLFDDTKTYFYAETPTAGVKLAGAGVTLRVTKQKKSTMNVRLGVSRPMVAVSGQN